MVIFWVREESKVYVYCREEQEIMVFDSVEEAVVVKNKMESMDHIEEARVISMKGVDQT